ncbi:hypothetical protein PAXRUDRAFT_315129 [Paxillus rubicundulus Ve08.2h10]|uniref:Uncharacterized protein n=1 Tax=Paxillus rubicundulus Ve08.2h10 TaxID=930991 RepID=A0A0D0DXC0_9AGAM|nr:hypothetical protein PAXRUDRAFT_315129 [Paxillus rubicundulus Ve08.2h10]
MVLRPSTWLLYVCHVRLRMGLVRLVIDEMTFLAHELELKQSLLRATILIYRPLAYYHHIRILTAADQKVLTQHSCAT